MRKKILILLLVCLFTNSCATVTGRRFGAFIDDVSITTQIRTRLAQEEDIHGFWINIDTYQGHVTLSGRVLTVEQEERVIDAAQSVPGVIDVASNLQIGEE